MRRATIAILLLNLLTLCTVASAQNTSQNPSATEAWHWFENCGVKRLGLVLLLDGKAVYRSDFSVCRNIGPTPTAKEHMLVFHFRGGHVFQGEYRTQASQTVEANIWQAGADPDALLLGVTFATERQILLNTIHIAKPDSTSVTLLDRGIVVRTFPLRGK